ncbi:hypothetical protein R6Q59_013264 [Mikania micrantha]
MTVLNQIHVLTVWIYTKNELRLEILPLSWFKQKIGYRKWGVANTKAWLRLSTEVCTTSTHGPDKKSKEEVGARRGCYQASSPGEGVAGGGRMRDDQWCRRENKPVAPGSFLCSHDRTPTHLYVAGYVVSRVSGGLNGLPHLLVGYFIRSILKLRGVPENLSIYYVIVWLFNSFTFTIGTRGNCNIFQGAVWYGLVVHMRIYPIIYDIPIILILDPNHYRPGKKTSIINWNSRQPKPNAILGSTKFFDLNRIFTRLRILFGLISAIIFFFFTGIFFYHYKWEFLHEALLYHLTRTDPRHNFSIYFYHIYLNYEREFSVLEKLISFLPQLIVQIVLTFRFTQDFPFCLFVQTVAFNKASIQQIVNCADPSFRGQIQPLWILLNSTAVWSLD